MITSLQLKNFKSHRDTSLHLKGLTVLAGTNGVGKSSAIQAMLLLRQSYQNKHLDKGLDLNGRHCNIGEGTDALYQYADPEEISFVLGLNGQELAFVFNASGDFRRETFLPLHSGPSTEQLKAVSLFGHNFHYISASRWAPRESYPKDTYEVSVERQLSLEKGQGELVVHFLEKHGRTPIVSSLLQNPTTDSSDLIDQSSAWSGEISKNVTIVPKELGKGYELRYKFSREEGRFDTNEFRAENVGFGVTYTLPIIVAILSSSPGALIIIENPEAHLHPAGQSKLAELMVLAAQAGVQLIIETHSDHIINGILVACKRRLFNASELCSIYYINRDEAEHTAKATEVVIAGNGRIKRAPEGFFDQISKDLRTLMLNE